MSDYQRLRVEAVCADLGLTSLAPLWRVPQRECCDGCATRARRGLVKVAAMGLSPSKHLGASIADASEELCRIEDEYGSYCAGEGGEFETLVVDCPMFVRGRLALMKRARQDERGRVRPERTPRRRGVRGGFERKRRFHRARTRDVGGGRVRDGERARRVQRVGVDERRVFALDDERVAVDGVSASFVPLDGVVDHDVCFNLRRGHGVARGVRGRHLSVRARASSSASAPPPPLSRGRASP